MEGTQDTSDCDVYSNRVRAVKWMQVTKTREPAEMRQNEDGLDGPRTRKSVVYFHFLLLQ